MNQDPKAEFVQECRHLVAVTAVAASEAMPLSKRIMIYRGLASLFPDGSDEARHAQEVAEALDIAERQQLRLTNILDGTRDCRDSILDDLVIRHVGNGETPTGDLSEFIPIAEEAKRLGHYSPKSGTTDAAFSLRNRAYRLGLLERPRRQPEQAV